MITRFAPRLDILPEPQKKLWPELRSVPRHFVLYGGTAIALRLGHRQSVDFDFFSAQCFTLEQLEKEWPVLTRAEVLQTSHNTVTLLLQRDGAVKLSFFGGLTIGRVGDPQITEDGIVQVASMLDLLATKLKVIQQRAENRDYLDIAELLKSGAALSDGLSAARALYGEVFNPMVTLKALTYFEDGNLPSLPSETKNLLRLSAQNTTTVPAITRKSNDLI